MKHDFLDLFAAVGFNAVRANTLAKVAREKGVEPLEIAFNRRIITTEQVEAFAMLSFVAKRTTPETREAYVQMLRMAHAGDWPADEHKRLYGRAAKAQQANVAAAIDGDATGCKSLLWPLMKAPDVDHKKYNPRKAGGIKY